MDAPDLNGVDADGAVLRVLEDEEDEHGGDGHARVERRGEDVCSVNTRR